MRVLLLSEPGSIHTIRWANALAKGGVDILVFGLGQFKAGDYRPEVKVLTEGKGHRGILNKLSYPISWFRLKSVIKEFSPQIVHAHYATSYGLLGRLSGFHPLIISVWGSDIYEFPRKSWAHRQLLSSNLASATRILSTSHAMATELLRYIKKNRVIEVTPFGIDLAHFQRKDHLKPREIVIGTVKALSAIYGIDVLIRAFDMLKKRLPQTPLKLVIAGDGEEKSRLRKLTQDLRRNESIDFLGRIDHRQIPQVLGTFDIFAALSKSESFGVAVIEASACCLPVVVSDVGGLPEIVADGLTGIVVPKGDVKKASDALERLVLDNDLRRQMGEQGRKRVESLYNWDSNVDQMIQIYKEVIEHPGRVY